MRQLVDYFLEIGGESLAFPLAVQELLERLSLKLWWIL